MPIEKEILNMLDLGRKLFQLFYYIEIGKDRKGLVYPQIDKPFRCINIYNPKVSVARWVHPLTKTIFSSGTNRLKVCSSCVADCTVVVTP